MIPAELRSLACFRKDKAALADLVQWKQGLQRQTIKLQSKQCSITRIRLADTSNGLLFYYPHLTEEDIECTSRGIE